MLASDVDVGAVASAQARVCAQFQWAGMAPHLRSSAELIPSKERCGGCCDGCVRSAFEALHAY